MSGWRERPVDPGQVAALAAAGFSPLQARLLALRGVTPAAVEGYLHPSLQALAAPEELPGVAEARARILAHVRAGGRIVVFGDYDCDGICATAILYTALEALAPGRAGHFIPDRLTEGYGMGAASVARMLGENPGTTLVVTVDNGITCGEQVAALAARGVEVIVTEDRKSTRLNSSHESESRMPSSAWRHV